MRNTVPTKCVHLRNTVSTKSLCLKNTVPTKIVHHPPSPPPTLVNRGLPAVCWLMRDPTREDTTPARACSGCCKYKPHLLLSIVQLNPFDQCVIRGQFAKPHSIDSAIRSYQNGGAGGPITQQLK